MKNISWQNEQKIEKYRLLIISKNNTLNEETLNQDRGGAKAYWGAVSDDGKYLVEGYLFNGKNTGDFKAAYVIVNINQDENGQFSLGTNYQVVITSDGHQTLLPADMSEEAVLFFIDWYEYWLDVRRWYNSQPKAYPC